MSYFRARAGTVAVTPETIATLAELVGLPIPSEDLTPLAAAMQSQLADFESLDELDLTDVDPVLEFDPRWQD